MSKKEHLDVQEEEFFTGHQRHGSVHLLTQLPYCFRTKHLQCATFSGNCQSLWMSKFLASNDKDSLVCRSPVLAMALGGPEQNCLGMSEKYPGETRSYFREKFRAGSTAQWIKNLVYWREKQSPVPSNHVKCQVWWHVLEMLGRQTKEDPQG